MMAENTHIQWAHHSFNPWWGCAKISEGCENCYAEIKANLHRHHEQLWSGNRSTMAESTWKKLATMNNKAKRSGVQARVFVGSMCDIADVLGPSSERERMFAAPALYPWLIFMFLTKRVDRFLQYAQKYWPDGVPENVWFGFTAEDQKNFDKRWNDIENNAERIPQFAKVFMSYEPAIGPLNLHQEAVPDWLDLVIAGGESGHKARAANPIWFRMVRDQCKELEIDFMFKQWGEYYPAGRVMMRGGQTRFDVYGGGDITIRGAKIAWHDKKNRIPMFRRFEQGGPIVERVGLQVLERDGVLNLLDGEIHNGGLL